MANQMTPAELRETAKRLYKLGGQFDPNTDEAADVIAGADALDRLAGILDRDEEVAEDEGWHIGGAWGDYGEVVVPLRILSYVIGGELDQQVVSTDPGYALTYAEQVQRAEQAEQRLADVIDYTEDMYGGEGVGEYLVDCDAGSVWRIARGDTTNHENRSGDDA